MARPRGVPLAVALLASVGIIVAGLLWWDRPRPSSFADLSPSEKAALADHFEKATRHIRLAEWEKAEGELEACLGIFPTNCGVFASLGEVYRGYRTSRDRYTFTEDEEDALVDKSLAAVTRALMIDPECIDALKLRYELRRNAALRRFLPDGALADGEEILRLGPEDLGFRLCHLAWLLGGVRFSRRREGQADFDSAIGLEVAERHLEWMLDQATPGTELYAQTIHGFGTVYLRMGEFDRAESYFRRLNPSTVPADFLGRNLADLGIALFRQERYADAAETFEKSMRARSTLETAWLLRLTWEKLGRDPEEIPSDLRFPIPPEEVNLERHGRLRFTEVGKEMGVAKLDGAGPSAFADFDGDGDPDILAAGCDTFTALYRNDGDRFEDVTIDAGLFELESGFSMNLVDYDNDGHLDIYISRNGWSGPARNVLYRNMGDGTFEDRSAESGLDDPGSGFVSLWSDFDMDGDLDVYIANGVLHDGSSNRLYRNRGHGTFVDGTGPAGLEEPRGWATIGAAVGDYDKDGDPDIFVNGRECPRSPLALPSRSPNRLYRNRGDGTFDEVAEEAGITASTHDGYVAFFLDYNNDAYPDLLATALARWNAVLLGLGHVNTPKKAEEMDQDVPRLYRNDKDGTFTEVTFEAGLVYPHGIMGANVGDLDNDGYIDLYFGTGDPEPKRLEPTVFYHNDGDGTFTNLTRFTGLGHLGKGHGFTFADFDHDGDLDIYAPQGGFCHGDFWANPFYRNEAGNENHWFHLDLRGTKSNKFAVGAQVTLKSGEMIQYREVTAGIGFGSTNSYPVEFGLGDRARIDEVEILWPGGGRQTLLAPPIDSALQVEEGREGWEVIYSRGGE